MNDVEATVRHADSHIARETHAFGVELSLTLEWQKTSRIKAIPKLPM